jgi:glycosyltransferase involved in cell wall biosynthesis
MSDSSISVIIAVKNGRRTINKCVDSILALPNKDIEIIVVDDGSTDETYQILKGYGSLLSVIRNQKSIGPAESRNIAVSRARGRYVAFTDGDCIVDNGWLNELKKGFNGDRVASVGGVQESPEDESAFGRRVNKFLKKTLFITEYARDKSGGVRAVDHNASCNSMYRKDIFLNAGGFWKGFWPGEDVDLDHRLKINGYQINFNPAAVVYHYRAGDPGAFCRMMSRYGWAQGVLVRRYGITRRVQWLPIAILLWVALMVWNFSLALWCLGLIVVILLLIGRADMYFLGFAGTALFFWNTGFIKGLFVSRMKDL